MSVRPSVRPSLSVTLISRHRTMSLVSLGHSSQSWILRVASNKCVKDGYPHVNSKNWTSNPWNLGNSVTCEIRCKVVLFTHRKWHTGFWLVQKVVTLNDLERSNGHYFVLFHKICWLWGPIMSMWLKLNPYGLRPKCSPANLVFGSMWFMMIFSEITERQCIKESHPHLKAKIGVVQHCMAISATAQSAELLL